MGGGNGANTYAGVQRRHQSVCVQGSPPSAASPPSPEPAILRRPNEFQPGLAGEHERPAAVAGARSPCKGASRRHTGSRSPGRRRRAAAALLALRPVFHYKMLACACVSKAREKMRSVGGRAIAVLRCWAGGGMADCRSPLSTAGCVVAALAISWRGAIRWRAQGRR